MYCQSSRSVFSQPSVLAARTEQAENKRFGLCTCAPGHGHNYVLFVSIAGELDNYGIAELSSQASDHHSQLELSYLNDVWSEFQQTLPTTEHIARVIWQRLASTTLSPHPVV